MSGPCIILWGFDPARARLVLGSMEARAFEGFLLLYPPLQSTPEHLYQQQDLFAAYVAQLSRTLDCTALGVVNLEDTALLLWVYHRGQQVFQYDSNPMYLSCPVCSYSSETVSVEMSGLEDLCRLLGMPQHTRAVRSWLVRRRGLGFLSERERLEKILALLKLPDPYPAQGCIHPQ